MHIRQPEIAAGVTVREFLVIEPEEVKQRRVQIMHVDLVLDCCEAKLIRRSIHEALFQACTRKPHGKAIRVVISAVHHAGVRSQVRQLDRWRAAPSGQSGLRHG